MKRLHMALARFHAAQLDELRRTDLYPDIHKPLTRKERDQSAQLDLLSSKLDTLDHDVTDLRQHNRGLQVTHDRLQADVTRAQDAINRNMDALQRRIRTVSVGADISPGSGQEARAVRHLGRTLVQKLIRENLLKLSNTGNTFTLAVNVIQPQKPTGLDVHLLDSLLGLGVPEAWAEAALSRELDKLGNRARPVADLLQRLHHEYLATLPVTTITCTDPAADVNVTVTLDPALDATPQLSPKASWQTAPGDRLSRAAQPTQRPASVRAEPDLRPRGQVRTLSRTEEDVWPAHLFPAHPHYDLPVRVPGLDTPSPSVSTCADPEPDRSRDASPADSSGGSYGGCDQ